MIARNYPALMQYLYDRSQMPFAWGTNDCVTFAAGAVQAQTGVDVLADIPKWTTEAEARAILATYGGLDAAVSKLLAEVHPAKAHRGDVGACNSVNGGLLLVVVVGQAVVGPDLRGLKHQPRAVMVKSWSAG